LNVVLNNTTKTSFTSLKKDNEDLKSDSTIKTG